MYRQPVFVRRVLDTWFYVQVPYFAIVIAVGAALSLPALAALVLILAALRLA